MAYTGRFAPSPTGDLHIGSLSAAVASYLHARRAGGEWLVRIEDIDPPREVPGAATAILKTLEAFHLEWDRDVRYQSSHLAEYAAAARSLLEDGSAFSCSCTRSELRQKTEPGRLGARYPGLCRNRSTHDRPTAIRVRVDPGAVTFTDGLQGDQAYDLAALTGDYLIFRKDALPAYHLAVVLDDVDQGITHVVRGTDLLAATAVHIHLQRTLRVATPRYVHVPIIVNAAGQKLSKQTGAQPVDEVDVAERAMDALAYLGLKPPRDLQGAPPRELWPWAVENWRPSTLAGKAWLQEF